MAFTLNSSLSIYFLKTDDNRVSCKICRKSLMANRNFNLKQHLLHRHKILIHTEKRPKKEKPPPKKKLKGDKQSALLKIPSSLSVDSRDNLYEINNQASLESNDSFARDSIDPTSIKPDGIQKVHTIDIDDENETTFEIVKNLEDANFDNNIEATTADLSDQLLEHSTKHDGLEELPEKPMKSKGNLNNPLIAHGRINRDDLKTQYKKRKKASLSDDPLDESGPLRNDDCFDQWAHKKEKLMQLEYIEMRNYKLKLELWEKEQQLHLLCSKYTRNIRSNL